MGVISPPARLGGILRARADPEHGAGRPAQMRGTRAGACGGPGFAALMQRVQTVRHGMGLDQEHMGFLAMTQAVPPAYAQLIFAQACMRELESNFGVTPITFAISSKTLNPGGSPWAIRMEVSILVKGKGLGDCFAGGCTSKSEHLLGEGVSTPEELASLAEGGVQTP